MFLLSSVYNSKFLDVTDEDFKENELMMEGAGNAFGCFMVSTVVTLTEFFIAYLDRHVLFLLNKETLIAFLSK